MTLTEKHLERFQKFFGKYEIHATRTLTGRKEKTYIGNKTDGCRFCGKPRGEVKFDTPHVIPQLMGNKYLVSHFECAGCNAIFKVHEDSLANYLGAYRTMTKTKNKSKTPKFKYDQTGLAISEIEGGVVQVISPDFRDVELDVENLRGKIKAKRNPYIPLHVFKILTKIGCCLIPESELRYFTKTMKFLIEDHKGNPFKNDPDLFTLLVNFIPGPSFFPEPVGMIFKRKADVSDVPARMFVFCYKNLVLQTIIPFCELDDHLLKGPITITIPLIPVLISKEWFDQFGPDQFYNVPLFSTEKTRDEDATVELKFTRLEKR